MKSFVVILAIVASIGIILLTENVNGETIKILTPDGKYIPGSVLKWIAVFNDVRKQTAPEGLQYIDYWISQVEPVDEALKNGELKRVATIFRDVIPVIRKLVPHLKDKKLQEYITAAARKAENTVTTLEMNSANMSGLSSFFESESKNLGDILKVLVGAVVNVVKNLLQNVVDG